MQHSRKQIFSGALAVSAAAVLGYVQPGYAQEVPGPTTDRVFVRSGPVGGTVMAQGIAGAGPATVQFIASEMSFDAKVVKGAPYSAQAVTETTQTLADGNRIHRTVTAGVYRDSEGRTRREQTFAGIGPFATATDGPQTVFLNDPVSGNNYILETNEKIARKMPAPPPDLMLQKPGETGASSSSEGPSGPVRAKIFAHKAVTVSGPGGPGGAVAMAIPATPIGIDAVKFQPQTRTESLGTQSIEGLQAQGSRTTMTIAAGAIGNDRPIDVVSERWYSPELQTVVMTKHTDPRMGETVYRLTNVSRTEPSAALFQVPADYTVEDQPAVFHMRVPKPGESK